MASRLRFLSKLPKLLGHCTVSLVRTARRGIAMGSDMEENMNFLVGWLVSKDWPDRFGFW